MLKNKTLLLCIMIYPFILFKQIYSQDNSWKWQYPKPQGNTINDIFLFNNDTAIAVGNLGTILKTTDGGNKWNVLHHADGTSYDLYGVHFIDKLNGWTIGMMDQSTTQEGNVLLKTTDGGDNWTVVKVNTTLRLKSVWFVDADTGIVVGEDGIVLRTIDGGNSWDIKKMDNYIKQGSYLDIFWLQKVVFTDKMNGWIVGYGYYGNQIYRTTDCGRTWKWNEGLILPKVYKSLNDISFIGRNNVFIVGSGGIFLKSTDGGASWKCVSLSQKYRNMTYQYLYSVCFTDSLTGWISGGDINSCLLKTTDGGENWNEIDSSEHQGHLYTVKFSDRNNGWSAGLFGRIIRTIDGGSNWSSQGWDKPTRFHSVYFADENSGWAVGDSGVIFHTSDGGDNWDKQAFDPKILLQSVYGIDKEIVWAAGGSRVALGGEERRLSLLMYTTDGGHNWLKKQGLPKTYWFSTIYFQNDSVGWITGTEGMLLKTTDRGNSWRKIELNTDSIFSKIQFVNDTTGWLSYSYGNYIKKTTDGGITWKDQTVSSNIRMHSFYFIDEFTGWAAGEYRILKTTDGGESWSDCVGASSAEYYSIHFFDEKTGWAAGNYSYRSIITKTTDGGISWFKQKSPLEGSVRNAFSLNEKINWIVGDGIAKTTDGGGILSVLENNDRGSCTPNHLILAQNFPNPFNPSTIIQYSLKETGYVTLKIYDMLGREVSTLVNKWQCAGEYKVKWTAGMLPSGIYIYQLRLGNFVATKKLMFLK